MPPPPSHLIRLFRSLRLRTQLVLVIAIAGGLPLAFSAVVAHRASTDALTRAAIARVETMRVGRVAQIEQAFATVAAQALTLAEDATIIDGSRALITSFHRIGIDATPTQLEQARERVSTFYAHDFAQHLRERSGHTGTPDVAMRVPSSAAGLIAQQRFIADNPHPLGAKQQLNSAGADDYAQVHARLHPQLRSYLERFGYYDIFVIDTATDVVVYTVFKETDFGKRLNEADLAHDGLVRAYVAARNSAQHSTHFEDFAPYEPSYNDAAAFVSTPIYSNGVVVAVLAMQLPVDRINGIVNEPTGLGSTGRAFLVGADGRMRTQDPQSQQSTIFVRRIDSDAVRSAAVGNVGAGRYLSGGNAVLGAWAPVRIDGLSWSLVVELEEGEALAAVSALSSSLRLVLLVSVLVLAIVGLLISARLARRIGSAVDTAEAVAHGDFASPIEVDGDDEIGVLLSALQQMRGALVQQMSSIEAQAAALQLLLDSTGDALVPVGRDGGVQPGSSTIARTWFGEVEPGTPVWTYLFGEQTQRAIAFELGFSQMADDVLPFELLADQMPSRFYRGDREFKIEFRRVGGEQLEAVLIIVRDITALVEAEKREADFRQIHQAMQVLSRDRDGFRKGLDEIDRLLTDLERNWHDDVVHRRALHTIKGSAGVLGFSGVAEACHAIEDILKDDPSRVSGANFSAVRTAWLLMLSQIETFLGDDDGIRIDVSDYERLLSKLRARSDHDELLSLVRSFLDEPTRGPLNRLAAQAARVAEQLGKAVEITIVDNDVRLPVNTCDGLWLSTIHLVRNAIDHGIEAPLARRAAGKSVVGTLAISTATRDEQLVVTFVDDGGGIAWDRIRLKALERGLPAATHDDLVDALFADGLSTRDDSNAWSGRGLGMAAVKAAVLELSGTIAVESAPGGTAVTLRIPLASLRAVHATTAATLDMQASQAA